jgi:hypothetical protein
MELGEEGGKPQKKKPGRKPGQRTRTGLELARDRAEMERLRLRYRYTPYRIAEEINKFYKDEPEESFDDKGRLILRPHVSHKQVEADLLKAKEYYQALQFETTQEKRLEIIRQFYDLAAYCQERYDASIEDKITKMSESRDSSEKGNTSTERETIVNTDGNPRYLEIKSFCLKFIAELEAVIPPKKIAPTNPDGTEGYKFEGGEELKRLAALAIEAGALLPPAKEGLLGDG